MAFRLPDTEAWTREDTERWLTDFPLPADFVFHGERAYPRYRLKCGYGQWLRTAGPYHAALRGLFALCHDILSSVPVGQAMPNAQQLADRIAIRIAQQPEQLPMTLDDSVVAPAGARHPDEVVEN